VNPAFVDLKRGYDRAAREKLWGVLQENMVDIPLLLAITLLHSSGEACVSINRISSHKRVGASLWKDKRCGKPFALYPRLGLACFHRIAP